MVKVGIFGASGYTGVELLKILRRHPQVEVVFGTSESSGGQKLADIYPTTDELELVATDAAPIDRIDLAFLCLPHMTAQEQAKKLLDAGVRVVDLSADFRLKDAAAYKQYYAHEHTMPELLPQAVYGQVETHRSQIKGAKLVAVPGCYPTSAILGVYPLAKAGLLSDAPIIIDAKSGVSGAGRKLALSSHFVEANENISPYNIGHSHRHVPEIEQEINAAAGTAKKIIFAPHLVPINQGMLSTIYVQPTKSMDTNELIGLYRHAYEAEPFVKVLGPGKLATMRYVIGNNQCVISLTGVNGTAIICSAIDNLIKGASGQAVQNMNVMCGFDETAGLI
ncbi:MAG: N-acetyl-gamma-glutamyl-phosphate reductase [Chloroflexi bacterium]|nr:N-acetyl-gamma-glutamyl-phosphate reductase [Chloroflexota bacterium]